MAHYMMLHYFMTDQKKRYKRWYTIYVYYICRDVCEMESVTAKKLDKLS